MQQIGAIAALAHFACAHVASSAATLRRLVATLRRLVATLTCLILTLTCLALTSGAPAASSHSWATVITIVLPS
jgi:hypothetical protein